MLNVSWTKCAGGVWCELEKVNVAAVASSGVFVVWLGGDRPRTVRVGRGRIATVVRAQRHDIKVLNYRRMGTLYVTWAALPDYESKGAVLHLNRALRPLIVDKFEDSAVIEVSLPGIGKR